MTLFNLLGVMVTSAIILYLCIIVSRVLSFDKASKWCKDNQGRCLFLVLKPWSWKYETIEYNEKLMVDSSKVDALTKAKPEYSKNTHYLRELIVAMEVLQSNYDEKDNLLLLTFTQNKEVFVTFDTYLKTTYAELRLSEVYDEYSQKLFKEEMEYLEEVFKNEG